MTSPLSPGAILDGKYRLTSRIGEGGMGTVFEGENVRIKRKVAIKVLHEHVATSPEFAQRFVREARASARIGSEHVCDVLDLGDLESGEKYIVMELLDGESMEARLTRDGQIAPKVLAPIVFEILEGLGAMHQVGVIHRDLKPANVFLCKTKGGGVSVKILDFGVAKVEASEEDPSGIHDMTTTGTMMGTPLYMSPEQARGARDVDGRTDLYAASVIFYQGLTGETPHSGVSLHELLFKIVLDDPKPIQSLAPHVDDELCAIVMRGLARDPDQRYRSAREFQEALAAWAPKHDLSFEITLPVEPPPLRKQTGGFPTAIIESAGPAMRTGNTPVSLSPNPSKDASRPPVDPTAVTQPSNPPAPLASATIRTGEPVKPSEPLKPGDTLVAGAESPAAPRPASRPPPPAEEAPATKSVEPKPAASRATAPAIAAASTAPAAARSSSKTTLVAGAVVVVVAAFLGIKLGTAGPGPGPGPSSTSAAPPVSVSAPPPPVSVPAATSAAPELSVPAGAADAAAPKASGVGSPGTHLAPPVPRPPPATSASASGRTIRTEPGF